MPEVTVSLGVVPIKKLVRNLKEFSRELRDDIKVDIEQATCAELAMEIRTDIASITDLDGNYLGGENPNASVVVEVGLKGHDVIWRGKQIAFLEFGTGAAGASSPYPGSAMAKAGYHPDPTKEGWAYEDAHLGYQWSYGLVPQAPMYHASMLLRSRVLQNPAVTVVNRGIARAVSI